MKSLWILTSKNLKLLLRSKGSSLVVFCAPLLIILILGLSYNTSTKYSLNIGVYSSAFTEDVNSFMNTLQEEEFKIIKYTNLDECKEDIKLGFIHACISLPENLKVESNTPKEVTFLIDPAKINLVWMIQETLKSKFNLKTQEISQELTKNVLAKLVETKTKINEKNSEINSIKDKNSAATSSTESTKSGLNSIDLSPPPMDYSYASLTDFKTAVTNEITEAKAKINSAKSVVSDANTSSSVRDSLTVALTDVDKSINKINNQLDNEKFSETISRMEQDLTASKNKLAAASSAIGSAGNNLNQVSATINEAITSLSTLQTSLTEMQTNLDSLKVTEVGTIVNPLVTKIERVGKESTYLNYSFSTLLILVIMFTSLLLGTTLVMMEKNSPAFLRNFFLPLRKTTFIISIYLTNLILILLQIIIILGIALAFLPEGLVVLPQIILLLFVSASVFTFLGMGIGYLFTSEETGILASISLGSLFLFISGVVLPIESIAPWLREITLYNPFVISEKLVREVFLFNSALGTIYTDLLILVSYAIVLFLVILIAETIFRKNIINRFMKHHHKLHRQNEKMNKNEV